MLIAVTGGTGTLGREVVAELARRGHELRVLARHAPARLPAGAEHRAVDLLGDRDLRPALDGVAALVDATNAGPRRAAAEALLVGGTQRLLAAEAAAGVEHHVATSIVGTDRVPLGYYRVKLAQEAAVARGPVPCTIVRATQFHDLLAGAFAATARFGLLPAAAIPLQPVDARAVARVLADTAEAEPSGAITQFAGPEVATVVDLARTWRLETRRRTLLVRLPAPGAAGRALRAGALTNPGAWRGGTTFAEWLRERAAAPPGATAAALPPHVGSAR